MKPGLVEGATPDRVMKLLADGKRRTLKLIALDLEPAAPHTIYTSAAQSLCMLYQKGKVQREKARGKFVYWRSDAIDMRKENDRANARLIAGAVFG